MPHISSKKLKKETLNKLYSQFGKAFEKAVYNSRTSLFLNDLLTRTEKIMLAKRFAVIYLLSEGLPYSYIAESLCMSYTTVYKMALKFDIGKYSMLIKAVGKEKKDLWEILEKILRAGLSPRYGRGRWRFLYEKPKNYFRN